MQNDDLFSWTDRPNMTALLIDWFFSTWDLGHRDIVRYVDATVNSQAQHRMLSGLISRDRPGQWKRGCSWPIVGFHGGRPAVERMTAKY